MSSKKRLKSDRWKWSVLIGSSWSWNQLISFTNNTPSLADHFKKIRQICDQYEDSGNIIFMLRDWKIKIQDINTFILQIQKRKGLKQFYSYGSWLKTMPLWSMIQNEYPNINFIMDHYSKGRSKRLFISWWLMIQKEYPNMNILYLWIMTQK